ncbi:hypothetical protein ISN44_As07g002940 [Arabidopsis suecica]|uniref:Uncharacterized protein n=1 Tax=Arabidopsis suecica TaxID=45249 RepID=A0A8T2BSK0_ARASU|nr:hypothetical protein ISN44_As07g002940 [Arabidopsis suecica]
MNAKKILVLLLIGVVCATVGAIRQLKEGSKETELGVSIPKATKGDKAEFLVTIYTQSIGDGNGYTDAKIKGRKGSSSSANGSGYGTTSGYVIAKGPNATAFSMSTAFGRGRADAAAGRKGANAKGDGAGGGTTVTYGSTGPKP